MDLLWIIENQISENPWNKHLRGNLQIDQSNEIQIVQFIYQSKAKNQRNLRRPKWSNSDLYIESNWPRKSTFDFWWKMNNARSNVKLKGQMNSEFNKFLSTESWWKEKSNETKIKWFGIIIRVISYFQNHKFFGLKFGENEEYQELICEIKLLNLIKTQITSW